MAERLVPLLFHHPLRVYFLPIGDVISLSLPGPCFRYTDIPHAGRKCYLDTRTCGMIFLVILLPPLLTQHTMPSMMEHLRPRFPYLNVPPHRCITLLSKTLFPLV